MILHLVIDAGSGISSSDDPGGWATAGLFLAAMLISTAILARLLSWLEIRTEVDRFLGRFDSRESGERMPPGVTETEGLRIATSNEAREFIGNSGGLLFVWPVSSRSFCLRLTTLETSCDPPPRALEFRRLNAGEFLLFLHPALRKLPTELSIEVIGRRHRHLAAYWDGLECVGWT